jgi:thiol-disulfide isomerase/thioredoxin
MNAPANLFATALLTLVCAWGLSGCSHQAVTASTATHADSEVGTDHNHATHTPGTVSEHSRDKHGPPDHKKGGSKLGEHNHHSHGGHHHNSPAPEAKVKVGDKVPDFSVRTLDGKIAKLSELQKDQTRTKTGIIVLTFWCSTCHSCRDVEHLLAKLCKDYGGQASVMALDANFDETAAGIVAFLKESGLEVPVVLDASGHTADLFGVNVTTTTVVIDGNGVLRYCGQFQHKDGGSAEKALQAVLAGNEVAIKTTAHLGCPIMRQ